MNRLLLTVFTCISYSLSAMEESLVATFPGIEALTAQFAPLNIPHDIEQLGIVNAFAEQTMTPVQINTTINSLFSKYTSEIHTPDEKAWISSHLTKVRSGLVRALLKNHPEVKQAVLQPTTEQ